MNAKLTIPTDDVVQQALLTMDKSLKKKLRPKLIAWGEKVLALAKAGVPVGEDEHPGTLRDSGRLIRPTLSSTQGRLLVSIEFGGARLADLVGEKRAKYAVVQHEDLTLHHDDGGPKFLERPFVAHAGEVEGLVAAAYDEVGAELP